MPGRLDGAVAIVTGAGSAGDGASIGRAIAVTFAREGADVCVGDIVAERAAHTVDAIIDDGGRALAATGDVSRSDDCGRIVSEVLERFGRVDIVVNNAGIRAHGTVHELDESDWDRVLAVNLKGAVLMARHALPAMIEAGRGAIVNISSVAGLRAGGGTAYGPAKAGLILHTQEVAVAYGRYGIRANAIAPGHVYTPMVSSEMTPEQREERMRIAPLGIEGTAWDVAAAALFLASDEARFVTGVCLPVDGGAVATLPLKAARLLNG